jgi:hypothetical protein
MGIVMLAGEWVDVETAASCVNFGAFSAFLAVNLCVLLDRSTESTPLPGGVWKLLQSAAGAIAALWLLVSLHKTALTVGGTWLLLGFAYLLYRTRGFRRTVLQPAVPSQATAEAG